jgi:hypothetical protein
MYACYFSVYTSIYLCCSFWYRLESFLLIKGSLVCFTLEIYNLSISFWNWTKIYNESINLKCFNNVKATDEHFVYFRTNPFTEWTIFLWEVQSQYVTVIGRVWIKWDKGSEFRQILKKNICICFQKVTLAVSKVRHLPHLPPLCYGHVQCMYRPELHLQSLDNLL